MIVEISGREFGLGPHLIERYIERVARHATPAEAEAALLELLPSAEIHLTLPAWAHELCLGTGGEQPDEWVVAPEQALVFPVRRGALLTCLSLRHVGATVRWR